MNTNKCGVVSQGSNNAPSVEEYGGSWFVSVRQLFMSVTCYSAFMIHRLAAAFA